MSKCIVCGKEASPILKCIKRGMMISLCDEHIKECVDCDIESCEHGFCSKAG